MKRYIQQFAINQRAKHVKMEEVVVEGKVVLI